MQLRVLRFWPSGHQLWRLQLLWLKMSLPLPATLPLCQELQPRGKRSRDRASMLYSLAKASFSTRTQALLEPGELAYLPEGSPRPGSKHRDVQITRARPAHLHRSTPLYKGQRSKALGKPWPRHACIMPSRHRHRNLDGSLTALGNIGYVSKAQLLHITA